MSISGKCYSGSEKLGIPWMPCTQNSVDTTADDTTISNSVWSMARVINIVATANVGCNLDLQKIVEHFPQAEYSALNFLRLPLKTSTPIEGHGRLYNNGQITLMV